MIRWKSASTILPSLKYIHVFLYHQALVPNQDFYNPLYHCKPANVSIAANQVTYFLVTNYNENKSYKFSKVAKCLFNFDHAIYDWVCFPQKGILLYFTPHCDNFISEKFGSMCYPKLWLKKTQYIYVSRSNYITDTSRLLEFGLQSSSQPLINNFAINSISAKAHRQHLSQITLVGETKRDTRRRRLHRLCGTQLWLADQAGSVYLAQQCYKQPADDPGEKIRALTEKLRIEAPKFMSRNDPYHDFSIYTKSVELYVTLKRFKFSLSGLQKYKLMASTFRYFHLLYLSRADMEILNLYTNEEQGTIEMRWRIAGWTPLGLITTYFTSCPVDQSYFDFSSTLYVNKSGQVWRHDVSKMQSLSDRLTVHGTIQEIGQKASSLATTMARQL